MKQLIGFILAGGIGKRLSPLSNKNFPKQFLQVSEILSLFQQTLLRNLFLDKIVIMTNSEYVDIVRDQISKLEHIIGLEHDIKKIDIEIIAEPANKDTASCVLTAAYYCKKNNIDEFILLPADHKISTNQIYKKDILDGFNYLNRDNKIVTYGVKIKKFNPNYGYIASRKIEGEDNKFIVEKFIEKPSKSASLIFDQDTSNYHNSGIYIIQTSYLLELAQVIDPDMLDLVKQAFDYSINEINSLDKNYKVYNLCYEHYQKLNAYSFDRHFIEKSNNVAMIKAAFNWSDLGSWESYIEHLVGDDSNHQFSHNLGRACKKPFIKIFESNYNAGIYYGKNIVIFWYKLGAIISKRGKYDDMKFISHDEMLSHNMLSLT